MYVRISVGLDKLCLFSLLLHILAECLSLEWQINKQWCFSLHPPPPPISLLRMLKYAECGNKITDWLAAETPDHLKSFDTQQESE